MIEEEVHAKPLAVYSSLLGGANTTLLGSNTLQQSAAASTLGTGRRWYLLVIVLLYIGLITSFCLNVTLLVRREPDRILRLEDMARVATGIF